MTEKVEKIEKVEKQRGKKPGSPKTGGRKAGSPNRATIAGYQDSVAASVKATVDRVLLEYSHIAFLDIRQAFTADGNLKPIAEWPDGLARSISGIEVEEVFTGVGPARVVSGRIHKMKICSKVSALDSVAKHLGMFVAQHRMVDQEGNDVKMPAIQVIISAEDSQL